MYFAFDVMGLVGFSKDFRQLEDAAEHAAIKELHEQMLFLGILKPVPWILTILGAIQGLVGNYGQFMTYCADRIAEKKKVSDGIEDIRSGKPLLTRDACRSGMPQRPKSHRMSYRGCSRPLKRRINQHHQGIKPSTRMADS
jgi:hypothetical protein